MAETTEVLSMDEIKKLAPNYKGKPENFKKGENPKKKSTQPRAGPSTNLVTPPTHMEQNRNPAPQRNESMITDAIFGPEMAGMEIAPLQTFSLNLAKLRSLAEETFDQISTDEKQFDRKLIKEEFNYYVTCLLWVRLIDIKAKEGRTALTSAEKEFRKMTEEFAFNVPSPIYIYLASIGALTDKGGKRTAVADHTLPTTVVQNQGGYHAAIIDAQNHSLFEEVPSLGVAADVIMACTANADQQPVNILVPNSLDLAYNNNLAGSYMEVGPRRPEIKQKLFNYGITLRLHRSQVRLVEHDST